MMIRFRPLLAWALLLLVVFLPSDRSLLPPGPRAALNLADTLLLDGHYYQALGAYQQIDARTLPVAALRLGMIRQIRGESQPAERAIRSAMQGGLQPIDYQLALLYLGQALADTAQADLADATWALAEDCRSPAACTYRAPARILAAEQALRRGAIAAAEASYRAALDVDPPAGWADLARARLALLLAAHDSAAAVALLNTPADSTSIAIPLLAPLIPATNGWPGQLAAVLVAEPAESRSFLLGRLYLDLGFYGMAETQLSTVATKAYARDAAVYIAYVSWLTGDHDAGRRQLEQLVAAQPDDIQARKLLALAYLMTGDRDAARNQITMADRLNPADPDIHLTWAGWHTANHDYPQASLEYSLALSLARPAQRGHYALLGAKFYLSTTYEICTSGMPLAEMATVALPDDSTAWVTLAAFQYYCGQYQAAITSAERAGVAGGAESAYYLGASLHAIGQQAQARKALTHAADLAPASVWRERAEKLLALMPEHQGQ
ncbi:MAG: hypothetical protein HGA65_05055 [Oscillochloris sp.]|nr:hypothetical protein [Oscillochloris sp.]